MKPSSGNAEDWFVTVPQSDEPLDASWRDHGYDYLKAPLVLKPGKDKITMTLNDLIIEDDDFSFLLDDSDRVARARLVIHDILTE